MTDIVVMLTLCGMLLVAVTSIGLTAFVVKRFLEQNKELVQLALIEQAQKNIMMKNTLERMKAKNSSVPKDRWNTNDPKKADESAYDFQC